MLGLLMTPGPLFVAERCVRYKDFEGDPRPDMSKLETRDGIWFHVALFMVDVRG